MNLNECQCSEPGFCPIFNRVMESDPPNWKWCQNCSSKQREDYYNRVKDSYFDIMPFIKKDGYEKSRYDIIANRLKCDHTEVVTIPNQIFDNTSVNIDASKIKILSLGHSNDQFKSIKDRDYIEKINLNDLHIEYGNNFAEGRIYEIDFDYLFGDKEIVGITTASWNLKYEGLSNIDNFINWPTVKLLQEEGYILGAQADCCCHLYNPQENKSTVLKSVGVKIEESLPVLVSLLEELGLKPNYKQTLYSNQVITTRKKLKELFHFYQKNNVLSRIKEKCDLLRSYVAVDNENYSQKRFEAYFTEIITGIWLTNQDYNLIPNEITINNWWSLGNPQKRLLWK